jgi:hypothetical protein
MSDLRVTSIHPPQPCGIVLEATGRLCGTPATLAVIEEAPMPFAPADAVPSGYLLLLPICAECARASVGALTAVLAEGDFVLVTHHMRLPTSPTPGVLREAAQLLDAQSERMTRDASILRQRADELAVRN